MSALHLEVLAQGPGHTIVASHALGLDHRLWKQWARDLHGRHTLLAFDHRGHGRSAPMGDHTMRDLCDEVAQHLKSWSDRPVVFVGLSMGGMIGQGLAIHHPDCLQSLVLAHTVSHYPTEAQAAWAQRIGNVLRGGMRAIIEPVTNRYLCERVRMQEPDRVDELCTLLLRNDPLNYAKACAAIAQVNWHNSLHKIHVPTLVIGGELDAGAPPQAISELAASIPGASLVQIKEASHLSPWETPVAFSTAIDRFLESLNT